MDSNRKKILVTLDESSHALDTVRYLSEILPPHQVDLVFFSVLNKEPECFLDNGERSSFRHELTVTSGWEIQQKKETEEFMENARQLIIDRGFPAESVMIKIQKKKIGIARDIIREAENGYDAVVAGRQGKNPITRLVIGSIASKLIQNLTHVPLWLVGKTTQSNKILVAIDASEGAMKAVEYLGSIVSGTNLEITLLSVIRTLEYKASEQDNKFLEAVSKNDLKDKSDNELAIQPVFKKAYKILTKAGINQDQITTKIISDVSTRSGTIFAQALSLGYGTIVLGRRGHSKVGEFYMGRVTNKVIQLAGKMAVWMVS